MQVATETVQPSQAVVAVQAVQVLMVQQVEQVVLVHPLILRGERQQAQVKMFLELVITQEAAAG
jgi:hypothetical protein